MPHPFFFWLCTLQSTYFLLTGLWPILHMRSFLAVTGHKHDLWLVRTVGALIVIVGLPLALAAWRRHPSPELLTLAIGSALVLMLVDIIYVLRRTIPPIYLADAAAELALLIAWTLYLLQPTPT